MKKLLHFVVLTIGLFIIIDSCSKSELDTASEIPSSEEKVVPDADKIAITVSIPEEGLTKVALTPDVNGNNKPILKLTWEVGDIVTINGKGFMITDEKYITNDGKSATFIGPNEPGNDPYTIVYSNLGNVNQQIQASDNNTDLLGYTATLTDVNAYKDVQFSSDWATEHGGTFSQSGVLHVQAKLPSAEIADAVQKVIIRTPGNNLLNGSDALEVTINTPGVEGDGQVVNVYAVLSEATTLTADTELLFNFQVGDNAYQKYTAYRKITSNTNLVLGQVNKLKINCSKINESAGTADAGTADNPYLIGDQNQMDAMHQLMVRGEKKYFKMIDDVDMTGIVWFPLNNGYPKSGGTKFSDNVYDKELDFNGNEKTISNLSTKSTSLTDSDEYASIFGVLMGNVYDLTIDNATITPRRKCGILAGYVGTGSYGPDHCEVTNVCIKNSTLTNGGSYCGGLAGQSAKAGNVFSNITITNCTVSTSGYAGGLIAYIGSSATISDITISKTNVTSSGHASTSDPVTDDGFAGGIVARVNAAVDFDRCSYKDGTVKGPECDKDSEASKRDRYIGGLFGYIANYETTIDDCQTSNVTLALVKAGGNNNFRQMGGAIGGIAGSNVVVGNSIGCTVTGLTGDANSTHIRNYVGGFIGYNIGGTIKNSTAAGTISGRGAVGGFAGQSDGGIFYNNSSSVSITGDGNIGGFIGWTITNVSSFEKCSASGNVSAGSNYAGGFCGIDKIGSSFTECSSSGTVTSNAAYVGGLIGYIDSDGATIIKCHSTSTVSGTNYIGGLIGVCKNATISKCYFNGQVSGTQKVGGILGTTSSKDNDVDIDNCYSRGSVTGSSSNQRFGGIVGDLGKGGSVINCWSDADVTGGRVCGGIVGLACYQTWADNTVANNTIRGCIAWNAKVKAIQSGNYGSSGAVIGHTSFKNVFGNCYRRSDMDYANSYNCSKDEWDTTCVDQTDCDGTNWAKGTTAGTKVGYTYQQPYYGVAKDPASFTVKSIAKDIIGWSSDIWDFTGDLPTLK